MHPKRRNRRILRTQVMIQRNSRIQKELRQLLLSPGPGILAFADEQDLTKINAQITGPDDSPYVGGVFDLKIEIPGNYPFEPPRVHFTTPVYHPNIDSEGRICLDTLKPQPQGTWSPATNINTLLLTLRLLLAYPNADDGLVPDITEEYRRSYVTYARKAAELTQRYAAQTPIHIGTNVNGNDAMDGPAAQATSSTAVDSTVAQSALPYATTVDHGTEHEESAAPPQPSATGSYLICADGYTLIGCSAAGLPHLRALLRKLEEDESNKVVGSGEQVVVASASAPAMTMVEPQEGTVSSSGKRKRGEGDHLSRKRG